MPRPSSFPVSAGAGKATKSPSSAEWANESLTITRRLYLDLPKDGVLDNKYYERNIGTVEDRLAAAGVRLAMLLNEIFSDQAGTTQPAATEPSTQPAVSEPAIGTQSSDAATHRQIVLSGSCGHVGGQAVYLVNQHPVALCIMLQPSRLWDRLVSTAHGGRGQRIKWEIPVSGTLMDWGSALRIAGSVGGGLIALGGLVSVIVFWVLDQQGRRAVIEEIAGEYQIPASEIARILEMFKGDAERLKALQAILKVPQERAKDVLDRMKQAAPALKGIHSHRFRISIVITIFGIVLVGTTALAGWLAPAVNRSNHTSPPPKPKSNPPIPAPSATDPVSIVENYDFSSGRMGATGDINVSQGGDTVHFEYTTSGHGPYQWDQTYIDGAVNPEAPRFAGVVSLKPPNEWGTNLAGGMDLQSYAGGTVEWEARSVNGPVHVQFLMGGVTWFWNHEAKTKVDSPYPDTMPWTKLGGPKALTEEWQKFIHPLPNEAESFKRVIAAFGWTVSWSDNGVEGAPPDQKVKKVKKLEFEVRTVRYVPPGR